ncbi:hypothetical protein, partial [Paraburkholderia caribensis]|uniref:hypothetical protein n=1 Tax=Paraburkholderia caribensis TaxID=75105 RepID=UPI0020911525
KKNWISKQKRGENIKKVPKYWEFIKILRTFAKSECRQRALSWTFLTIIKTPLQMDSPGWSGKQGH